MPQFRRAASAAAVAAALTCIPAGAQTADDLRDAEAESAGHSKRLFEGIRGDIKEFATAPVRWRGREWAQFGGVVAAVSAAYQYDAKTRVHFATDAEADYHEVQDSMPAALAFGSAWLAGKFLKNDEARGEAALMLRATMLSTISSEALKVTLRRERPGPGVSHDTWNGGGMSFPSGHTATAFAIGTVLAESGDDRHRWGRRTLGYGFVGLVTAYQRLNHDAHWLSDTVAGAALGIAAARFTMNRGERSESRGEVSLTPQNGGAMLTYNLPIRR